MAGISAALGIFGTSKKTVEYIPDCQIHSKLSAACTIRSVRSDIQIDRLRDAWAGCVKIEFMSDSPNSEHELT